MTQVDLARKWTWPGLKTGTKLACAPSIDGKAMVDKLKRSLDQLDPPTCPNCQSEMNWFRSSLEDAITIVHLFVCPGCSHTAETRTTARAGSVPPEKLSAPHRHAA